MSPLFEASLIIASMAALHGLVLIVRWWCRHPLSTTLVEELRRGLPLYLVVPDDRLGVIDIKHAFVSWSVRASRQSGGGVRYELRPQDEFDLEGRPLPQEPQVHCVVRSPHTARRLGRKMASIVRSSNGTDQVVMRFVPRPEFA